ncbi:alginate lyase-domain-containing protein [Gymnopilus junonius]|uniref:Alginate lyase-domain-containing protein n=1 Tax=Gymnopilus junonius TaxID=109634 RepID=A0A9P5P042_GYMJU|nr:alginate lyase-domain-containing protein [Gymnopilus junonius]
MWRQFPECRPAHAHCYSGDPNDWVNIEYVIAQAKSRFSGSSSTADAQTNIFREADASARRGPWTIVSSGGNLPPSGDAHDFLSWAPYHWPNCDWCSPTDRTYVIHDLYPSLNHYESLSGDNTSLPRSNGSNVNHEQAQSILAIPNLRTEGFSTPPGVTRAPSERAELSKREPVVSFPTPLPASSIVVLNPSSSTTSASDRRTHGPAQAAAKTSKVSCTASPTKSLEPSATWTTCSYFPRDGAVNPDVRTLKGPEAINSASQAVIYNAVAFALQKSSSYSKSAADIIETFFLNQTTKMNPNVQFGQIVRGPGQSGQDGTFTGVLDLRGLVKVVNGISILKAAGSPDWNETRHQGMASWASDYSEWLATSEVGKITASRPNNHGTFYISQLAAAKYLLGDRSGAIKILQNFCKTAFLDQIAKTGEQPFEAVRTRPYHYRCFNVEALITNAKLGDELGIDLWSCKSRYGATIQTAVDFLISTDPGDEDATQLYPHVAAISAAYGDPHGKYMAFLKEKETTYASKSYWFYDQTAAFPNAPALKKNSVTRTVWKREDSLTVRDNALDSSPVDVAFKCPDVFKSFWRVELDNDIYTTCDELQPFYGA